jgi:hypothetical protein
METHYIVRQSLYGGGKERINTENMPERKQNSRQRLNYNIKNSCSSINYILMYRAANSGARKLRLITAGSKRLVIFSSARETNCDCWICKSVNVCSLFLTYLENLRAYVKMDIKCVLFPSATFVLNISHSATYSASFAHSDDRNEHRSLYKALIGLLWLESELSRVNKR